MTIHELARYFLSQGKTVRAAALMMRLTETEPTPENLELLADIYVQQGLFDDAAELYLRVVKMGIETNSLNREETLR
jgi:pentatricopeptide repeat protein